MYVLLVTWIIAGQPPSSYQHEFSSETSCLLAKIKVQGEADKLKWQDDQKRAELEKRGVRIIVPSDPPRVSAICVAK